MIAYTDLDLLVEARREQLTEQARHERLLRHLRTRSHQRPSVPFWKHLALPRLPRRVEPVRHAP